MSPPKSVSTYQFKRLLNFDFDSSPCRFGDNIFVQLFTLQLLNFSLANSNSLLLQLLFGVFV